MNVHTFVQMSHGSWVILSKVQKEIRLRIRETCWSVAREPHSEVHFIFCVPQLPLTLPHMKWLLAGITEDVFRERVILLQHKQKKKSSCQCQPLPSLSSWLISLEPAGPAGRGIWQRTSDNPEESWHRERQSLHRLRPDWKMLSMQRADETNQGSQEGCLCRAG